MYSRIVDIELSVARKPGSVITVCPSPPGRLLRKGRLGMSVDASVSARGASISASNSDGGLATFTVDPSCFAGAFSRGDYT